MSIASAPNVPKDRISEAVVYGRSEMEPGRDAWELVKQAWMTKSPTVITLPVDPVKIARLLGIEVLFDDDLPDEVAGVLRKSRGFVDPVILLNPLDAHSRRRFICAHALGHFSRGVEGEPDEAWEFVDRRDLLSSPDPDAEESYATEFAVELLMPRIALREFLDNQGVVALASVFGVTADVMSFRLGRIGRSER
jgi:IrrE N-terminal-like domain